MDVFVLFFQANFADKYPIAGDFLTRLADILRDPPYERTRVQNSRKVCCYHYHAETNEEFYMYQ